MRRVNSNTWRCNAFCVTTGSFLIGYALLVWAQWDYIVSGFIRADDTHLIAAATLGERTLPDTGYRLALRLWGLLGKLESINIIQGAALVFIAVSTGAIAALLYGLTGNSFVSVGLSLFLSSYPLAVDQGAMFVTAMPHSFGAAAALASFAVFWSSWNARLSRFIIGMICTSILAYLSVRLASSARLMLFAPLLWALAMLPFFCPERRRLAFALLVFLAPPLTFGLQFGLIEHHYTGAGGWTSISPQNVGASIQAGLRATLVPILKATGPVMMLYMAGMLIIICAFVVALRKGVLFSESNRTMSNTFGGIIAFFVLCLITSALLFGPAAVVSTFKPRYAQASFLFAGMGIVATAMWFVVRKSQRAAQLAIVGIGLLVVANVIRGEDLRSQEHGELLRTHNQIRSFVEREQYRWPSGSQIVIIKDGSPTLGFNHWSTWYIRALTKDLNMIGLIGSADWIGEYPFVNRYVDHDAAYWSTDGSRSRRIKMKGLEYDRPLYLYEYDENAAAFVAKNILFVDSTSVYFVDFGAAPSTRRLHRLPSNVSCSELKESTFVWFILSGGPESNYDPNTDGERFFYCRVVMRKSGP